MSETEHAKNQLASIAWLGGIGGAAVAAYKLFGFGLPCPFLALTGWQCPFCGGTRMGAHLANLDFAQAFAANPFVFCLFGLLALVGIDSLLILAGRSGLPGRSLVTTRRVGYVAFVAGLIFTLARNL